MDCIIFIFTATLIFLEAQQVRGWGLSNMVYKDESGVGDIAKTQPADNFDAQPDTALIKKSERFTSDQKEIIAKEAENQAQKVLERKITGQDWNSLDEAKSAIVAKKNTIEDLSFSIESRKPSVTSQDLPPISTAINSLVQSKEEQADTANISYDHIRSVIDEKRKERSELDVDADADLELFSPEKEKNDFLKSNRLMLPILCGAVLLACCSITTVSKLNDLNDLIRRGDALYIQSKFSESLEYYDQALLRDNSLIGPRLKRAQILCSKGEYARALADCEYVLSRFPNDHQALKQCALLSVLCKKNKRALQCAQKLLRLQYTESKDLVVIIKALAASNEHLRAIYFYEKLSQIDRESSIDGNLIDTIKDSRIKANQYSYSKGLIELRKASISDPSRKIDYLLCMVDFAAKRKKYSDAAKICSEVLAMDSANTKAALKSVWFKYLLISPGNVPKNLVESAHKQRQNSRLMALKTKAFEAYEKEDYNSAVEALSQALQNNPQDPDLKRFLSYILMKASLLDRVSAYQNSNKASLDELITLMKILHDSRQTALASKVAANAVKRYPKEASANLEFQKIIKEGY